MGRVWLGYPCILPAKGSRVEGLLVKNIDAASLKKLDEYENEGRLYFQKKGDGDMRGEKGCL